MIKHDEHLQIEMLGRLEAALLILADIRLPRGEAATLLEEGCNKIRKAMLRQSDVTSYFVMPL